MKVLEPRGYYATPGDLRAANFSFKLVRDPFARATSSYSHQTDHDFFGAPAVRDRVNASAADTSFLRWLEAVAAVGLKRTDIHTRLQVTYRRPSGTRRDDVRFG